jgi:hypothetical protein
MIGRPFGLLALFLGAACSIDASERCAEERTWNGKYKGCLTPTETAGSSAGGSDSDGENAAGGRTAPGATGGETSTTQTAPTLRDNLGATCERNGDCSTGSASLCLLDPSAPTSPGVCTIPNCGTNDCGSEFRCCDCTQSPLLAATWTAPVCAPNSKVEQLTSPAVKCTCE